MSPLAAQLGPSWRACPDKPTFHVSPASGWINDPNGVTWHADVAAVGGHALHVFFQHIEGSTKWDWRMEWGHVVSRDGGATWTQCPVALRPTPGWVDASGVWSGCCVPADPGGAHAATILYTGVRRRTDAESDTHPVPPHANLGTMVHEVVCAATTDDAGLATWAKVVTPIIHHAPPGRGGANPPMPPPDEVVARLTRGLPPRTWYGFRDPFVYQRPVRSDAGPPSLSPLSRSTGVWRLLLGSGVDGAGTVLVYESPAADPAASEWRYVGEVVTGTPRAVAGCEGAPYRGLGCVWECPALVRVPVWDDGGDARDGGEVEAPPSSTTWRLPPPRAANDGDDEASLTAGPVALIVSPFRGDASPPRAAPIAWVGELTAGGGGDGDLTADGGGGRNDGVPATTNAGDKDACVPRLPLDAPSTVGPVVTDLGRLVYATTAARPPRGARDGRPLTFSWLQEDDGHAGGGGGDYAGCLTLPRRLWCDRGGDGGAYRLRQSVDPAVCGLRVGAPTTTASLVVGDDGAAVALPGATGAALDVRATLRAGARDGPTSLILLSRPHAGPDPDGVPCTVALVADWARGTLAAEWTVAATGAVTARVGGPCADVAAGAARVRVLVDGSAVEVFTGCGTVLSFRAYRGRDGDGDDGNDNEGDGSLLLSGPLDAAATDVSVWRMRPCWTLV